MTLVGQPPPSPALQHGFELVAQGKTVEAEDLLRAAAKKIKAQHGSGSHPLALAYGELGRLYLRMGKAQKAARAFEHAAKSFTPSDPQQQRDLLALRCGLGAALGKLGWYPEAIPLLRQCVTDARKLAGETSALAMVAQVPLADVLLKSGATDEAAVLAHQAYDALWRLGDPLFTATVGTRAEILKAMGEAGNPFVELDELPEEYISSAITNALSRMGQGDPEQVRAMLADLLQFVEGKYGDGHPLTCDAIAAVAHHERTMGAAGDETVRRKAVRRSIWSFAVRRLPDDLLANLDVAFEPDGDIRVTPQLARQPDETEAAQLDTVLREAVADLASRPRVRSE